MGCDVTLHEITMTTEFNLYFASCMYTQAHMDMDACVYKYIDVQMLCKPVPEKRGDIYCLERPQSHILPHAA